MKIKAYMLYGFAIMSLGILALISTEIQGSSANKIHNNLMVMGYAKIYEALAGGDYAEISHDGTDAYFKTDDGELVFLTDEGTNTNSYLSVKGKGTGFGVVRAYDNAEWATMYCAGGYAYFGASGSAPQGIYLENPAEVDVSTFFSAAEGETPEFKIYGYRTGDSKRALEIGVGVDAADTASFDGVSYYLHDGMVRQASIWHAYGGFEDQAETVACGVGDWNHITNAGTNLWNLDENDGITISGDVLTLTNTGDYMGTLSLSISALNGKDFHVRIYNNTQTAACGRPIGISTTGAGNEMNVAIPVYIEGTAADAIQFEIMSADGTDPDVDDGLFILTYLHD